MNPSTPRRLDIVEICQEASERAGIEFRAGYALTTARRSLELLQLEWANRGLNLWTIDRLEVPLLVGIPAYQLPEDTIDVLDAVVRNWPGTGTSMFSTTQWNDRPLERIGLGTWPEIYNKAAVGCPNSVLVHRVDPVEVRLHPIPDRLGGTLILYRLRYMAPLGASSASALDMPVRMIPAMIAGLAYKLALKSKGASFERAGLLKQLYEEEFDLAAGEDRDRTNVRFVPMIRP